MKQRTLKAIARRTKAHGSKTRLSEKTGIALPYLSRILRGIKVPSEAKAALLARELGIPASEFRVSR
jgi:transcriptional regulator with XRE-family HTH domain